MWSGPLKRFTSTATFSKGEPEIMTISQELRTARLLITPFSERHLTDHYVAWLKDPELVQYSEQRHKTHNLETCRTYWRSFEGTPHYFWALEEINRGYRHIGNINAYVDSHNSLADVGILIGDREAHNKGYGREALMAVFEFLFQGLGMRKVTQGCMALNTPMLKLMRGLGMVPDGVRQRHYLCKGQEVDIVHMALFREQWRSSPTL